MKDFEEETEERIEANGKDERLRASAGEFIKASIAGKYSYNFRWLGRPIIQYPQDIVVLQELLWSVQPDLVIETGIAHGGSLIFSASMLELNAACGGPADAEVLAVDIDIRRHNREAIESHPMFRRISMIEGSSVASEVVARVRAKASSKSRVLVCLDSNHTHDHVLSELQVYAPLTSIGSYCVVFDTVIESLPKSAFPDRPWGPGDNPQTAVREYVAAHPEFEVDERIDRKVLVSAAPGGYLRRTR